ncbi:MAG TPA: hypothetical protein VH702_11415 [Vicinamibacterales bacterium]
MTHAKSTVRTFPTPMRAALVLLFLVLTSASAAAQVDLSGVWEARNHEDLEGMLPGDYTGLPINDEARARADAFLLSYQAMPERQCIMYTTHYVVRGPQSLQIGSELDPISGRVVAWKMSGAVDRNPRTIWMDGRPHPSPIALHTPAGFSTGRWQGDRLQVTTTHLTEGVLSHNGVPSSNQATIREYIVRHGDRLMITMIVYDPVYLEEPYLRSRIWVYDPKAVRLPTEPCEPAVELIRPAGEVPHYLPGTNPFLSELTEKFNIPSEGLRGGASTLYPEYRKRLREQYVMPTRVPELPSQGGR